VTVAVVAAAGRRLVRRPRLAVRLLRFPALVPFRWVRARLYRSLSWPLALRLHMETEVTVADGSRMLVRTDDLVGRVLAISGVWESNVTAAFTRALAPGNVCLDIGAHIGYYTLLAARLVGPQGHVYAFEPSPANYGSLRANVDLNGLRNVTTAELAVGEQERRAVLYEGPPHNTGLTTLSPVLAAKSATPPRETIVDVGPITSVVPPEDLARVGVIKIDVEWHEIEVLRSLAPVFELDHGLSVLVEFTPHRDAPDAASQLAAVCEAHGFTMYRVPSGYSLERLFPERLEEPTSVDEALPGKKKYDLLLLR
jgi:FkbM family methyltransferase